MTTLYLYKRVDTGKNRKRDKGKIWLTVSTEKIADRKVLANIDIDAALPNDLQIRAYPELVQVNIETHYRYSINLSVVDHDAFASFTVRKGWGKGTKIDIGCNVTTAKRGNEFLSILKAHLESCAQLEVE